MQFYRDGYRPGNPDDRRGSGPGSRRDVSPRPAQVDVLIVGTGPAGVVLGAQLSEFPSITTMLVERRGGPLDVGQADGVACRTVEMFQAFGLAEALLREAYWVNEVRFWGPSDDDRERIVRTGWVQDTPPGLSEFPHVIVNQARMQQYLLDYMAMSPARLQPEYGVEFVSLSIGSGDHPVRVVLRHTTGPDVGSQFIVDAKYVVGCDGARSAVRESLGIRLRGDAANHAWGVMDVLANTDFPDWRTKNVIQSAGKGSLLMIPREGGTMIRLYVDLGEVPAGDSGIRNTTVDELVDIANTILHPYSIDVRSVAWTSVYEVGQRIADAFDNGGADGDGPRVFIAGDACHTHSAKAGQGMNVSMQDGFNLGWKLAAVLRGNAGPELLSSYSAERRAVAQDLIDFDRFWSDFIAQPVADPAHPELGGVTPEEMRAEFSRQGRYTAGVETRYGASAIVGAPEHQNVAVGYPVGARFQAYPVDRVADARRLHLGHTARADGRWRIYAFGDRDGLELQDFAEWWGEAPDAPPARFTPPGSDIDAVFDLQVVFQGLHREIALTALPAVLLPRTGPLSLQDWEKVWAAAPDDDIFEARGINRDGALVIVRPDQYVAQVLPLRARGAVAEFFAGILKDTSPTEAAPLSK